MEAKELRLGNLFFIPGLNRYVKVSAIFKTHFRCEDYDGISFEESIRTNYNPIPLTPEILVKAGLSKADDIGVNWWRHPLRPKYYWIFDKAEGLFYSGYYSGHGSHLGSGNKIINYLHEFQNAFLVIYGEELNIELSIKIPEFPKDRIGQWKGGA